MLQAWRRANWDRAPCCARGPAGARANSGRRAPSVPARRGLPVGDRAGQGAGCAPDDRDGRRDARPDVVGRARRRRVEIRRGGRRACAARRDRAGSRVPTPVLLRPRLRWSRHHLLERRLAVTLRRSGDRPLRRFARSGPVPAIAMMPARRPTLAAPLVASSARPPTRLIRARRPLRPQPHWSQPTPVLRWCRIAHRARQPEFRLRHRVRRQLA